MYKVLKTNEGFFSPINGYANLLRGGNLLAIESEEYDITENTYVNWMWANYPQAVYNVTYDDEGEVVNWGYLYDDEGHIQYPTRGKMIIEQEQIRYDTYDVKQYRNQATLYHDNWIQGMIGFYVKEHLSGYDTFINFVSMVRPEGALWDYYEILDAGEFESITGFVTEQLRLSHNIIFLLNR